jgi:uncharacterized repeat protein (TIGR03803 family)
LTTLWSFTGSADGAFPAGALFADEEAGAVYGTTNAGGSQTSGCGTVFKIDPANQTLITIWTFTGGSDGCAPIGQLIGDDRGALYGTAGGGGAFGNGTVFKLSPPARGQTAWSLTTLWSFSGGSDGALPLAGVIADEDGALYGTTARGGVLSTECGFGGRESSCGVVFKLTPPASGQTAWTETVLWSFSGGGDGWLPVAPVIADYRGTLYGTTSAGGAGSNRTCFFAGSTCGVVFKLTPPASGQGGWTQTVLWNFSGNSDGGNPLAGLTADKRGVLYGTARSGGILTDCPLFVGDSGRGCGVVYQLTGTGFVPGEGQQAGGS